LTVFEPEYKLEYFYGTGWEDKWIVVAKKKLRAAYDLNYTPKSVPVPAKPVSVRQVSSSCKPFSDLKLIFKSQLKIDLILYLKGRRYTRLLHRMSSKSILALSPKNARTCSSGGTITVTGSPIWLVWPLITCQSLVSSN
jgi:hypothetical protein